jgi:hypothetical protein
MYVHFTLFHLRVLVVHSSVMVLVLVFTHQQAGYRLTSLRRARRTSGGYLAAIFLCLREATEVCLSECGRGSDGRGGGIARQEWQMIHLDTRRVRPKRIALCDAEGERECMQDSPHISPRQIASSARCVPAWRSPRGASSSYRPRYNRP